MPDGSTTAPRSERAVVVGAGVGGLSAAIALAARGVEVTVVDRAARVGGKMREVEVAGRRLDAGPTVLTVRAVFDELFAAAGASLDAYVTLDPVEVLARHAWPDGSRLDLYRDVDRTADGIGALMGAREAKGYRAFCEYARGIHERVEGPFMRSQRPTLGSVLRDQGLRGMVALARIDATRTLWSSLGDFFRDPRLLQLFGRYATYCGSSPFLAPATLNVIAHVEREGVWVVRGGMARLAEALERLAAARGVTFALGRGVDEVLTAHGRAAGVRLDDGTSLAADAVVFNGDVGALSAGLLGEAARPAWTVAPNAGRSLSAVTFSAVARAGGFPLVRHNVFFSRDYAREFRELTDGDALPTDPTVYVCAQDRDDTARTPATDDGRERLFMIVNAPARGERRPFSEEDIDRCETTTRRHLEALGLSLDWDPARRVITTPTDFARSYPATEGALYGPPSHGWTSPLARAPSRSKLPGLYLCGGSAHPGAGVPMVARSGLLAAESAWSDLASTAPSRGAVTPGGTSTR
ncbi:MAG: phytoene desaturase [Myxococcaceae bacterium]|nr:phytoene desaturase [Myxococcaceae bacterium]